jgi:hypothetical protein
VACGFLHVDATLLQRVYMLFVMEIETGTVHIVGVTAYPMGSNTRTRPLYIRVQHGRSAQTRCGIIGLFDGLE